MTFEIVTLIGPSQPLHILLHQMETLEQLRGKLVNLCIGMKLEEEGVHTVSFQPLKSRINQDRVVTEKWDIGGQTWLFLAVCDGEFYHALQ